MIDIGKELQDAFDDGYRKRDAEIVRCKDCKYMTEHDFADGNIAYWTCSVWDSGTNYDGYCHYGEREEE